MESANVLRVRQYLQAVASMASFEKVAEFYAPDVVVQEFPNRIAPQGGFRRAGDLREAYERGRKIMRSQRYDVRRIVESGDDVAVELEWTGVLAAPVMNQAAASEMKAFVAMFVTFRDGQIASQRNYDCYPPFEGNAAKT